MGFLEDGNYPKVLVAIPTYAGKDYIFQENFKAIKSFKYPNYQYIYIDNTDGTSYISKLRRRGANVVHVPRNGNSRQALCNAQNYARKKALDENYDYLMFVESDLIPPPETIARLVNHQLKVVGATYFIGHEIKVPCIFFTEYKKDSGVTGTTLIKSDQVNRFLGHGLQKVHGMGLGCTLIRRDVFSRYAYWTDERFNHKHSDVYFYMDLWNDNVPVIADSDFIIAHYPSSWSEVSDK